MVQRLHFLIAILSAVAGAIWQRKLDIEFSGPI
jgi:hypothetical protein